MKLKQGFVVHTMGKETVLTAAGAAGFNGVVRCNVTAGFVVEHLKEETTEEALVAAMLDAFDATPEQAAEAVAKVLAQVRDIGALDE